jgi:hypothetical protein
MTYRILPGDLVRFSDERKPTWDYHVYVGDDFWIDNKGKIYRSVVSRDEACLPDGGAVDDNGYFIWRLEVVS